jgi:hypothetical protein
MTLWLEAQDRERRAEVLNATLTDELITIDSIPTTALTLNASESRGVAVLRHCDLVITEAAHGLDPASVRLAPILDAATRLLGPGPRRLG